MKTLFIRLGKAWNVIQRDGWWRGTKRVLSAFGMLFQRVQPGDILFIAGGVGDSARYRTRHVAEELRLHGFRASVTVQDNPFLLSYAETFSVFIFHRVLFTDSVKALVETIERMGKTVIFETDDLVYDPAYLHLMDYYRNMNSLEKKLYEHGLGGEILARPSVQVATTTTTFLAEALRQKGKDVIIVPNRLSREDVQWARRALECQQPVGKMVRIGYLSGTPSHDKDFATIAEPLIRILERFPATQLVLVGPLVISDTLKQYSDRIEHTAFVPRSELFAVIASLDINLAPLEIGNPFCESKSELKFFEAGIVRVPTVAAATQTFCEAIHDSVDGFVAATGEEWETKLAELIQDTQRRQVMGAAAYQTALSRYTTERATNEAYYSFLKNHITVTL